jgi:hypothetical protein
MEPEGDAEHLNHVEHDEERVVERGGTAGDRQVQGDRETDRGDPDGDQSNHPFRACALRVELHDRPGE